MYDLVVHGGTVIDPLDGVYPANIGIGDGKIEEVSDKPLKGKKEINGEGNMISPGFIDIHMHEDKIENDRIDFKVLNRMVRMGVTSVVGGNCGYGDVDIGTYFRHLEMQKSPVNYAGLIGHELIRRRAGCDDVYRKASPAELIRMKELLNKGLEEGALGLAFGLEYVPGTPLSEVLELSELVSHFPERMVATHFRFDAERSLEAIAEMIMIARETGVRSQVSHIGSCAASGHIDAALEMVSAARKGGVDVMADVYPYTAFSTRIGSAVFDGNPFEKWGVDPEAIRIIQGKYAGETCTKEIFEYMRKHEADNFVVASVMKEDEVITAMKHPLVMIASDGVLNKGQGHPRVAGTFPRFLGRYVRDLALMPLKEGIRKITLLPAETAGLKNKGRIQEGYDADITLFDFNKIIDTATFDDPLVEPEGIETVIVKGVPVIANGEFTGEGPGTVIRVQTEKQGG
jgi:N-acyl-D-amino-acid deacylase